MMTKIPYSYNMNMVFKAACLMLVISLVTSSALFENKLRDKLLKNNSKFVRPAPKNETVNVHFAFNLTQLLRVSESMHMIKTKCEVGMLWHNRYMKWNESEWNGVDELRVSPDEVWTPDISLWEDIHDDSGNGNFKVPIRSYSNGRHIWLITTTYESTCTFDVTNFPYDIHSCYMTFTSRSYLAAKLNMSTAHFSVSLPFPTATSSDWIILNNSVVRNETNIGVSYIRYTFVIGRKSTQFFSNILVPSFIQIIIIVFTFILPPESGERISVSVTVLLVFAVYLEVIRDQVPSGSSTTNVSKFYLAAMSGSAFSIIVTCFVLVIHFKGSEADVAPVPKWIKMIFLDCLAKCLCMKRKQSRVNDDTIVLANTSPNSAEHINKKDGEITTSSNAKDTNEIVAEVRIITSYLKEQDTQDNIETEWHLLAKVVDRLFFIIFLIFFVISTLVILLPIIR